MMTRPYAQPFKILLLCVLLSLTQLIAAETNSDTGRDANKNTNYYRVYAELTKYDNRLPGSPNFNSCVEYLKNHARSAGIEFYVQEYPSLIPQTTHCELRINGKACDNVYLLAPNGGVFPSTTFGKTIEGPH